jgi:hypothetical protein
MNRGTMKRGMDRRTRAKRSWLDQIGQEPAEKDKPQRTQLAPLYVILVLIVLLSVVVSILFLDVPEGQRLREVVERFGPNLATEALGILLTVVFVRRFLEQSERSRRLRASIGALRKARRALQDLVDTWTTTLKGCLQQRDPASYRNIRELLSPDSSDVLLWCDPFARRSGGENERWVAWAGKHVRAVQASLDQIVGTYGGTLDPEYVEALDNLIVDPFLRGFADLTLDEGIEPQRWRVALNTVRALRMAHFERLLTTIELHNRLAAEAAGVRGRAAAPRTSTLGVELAPDHDLRVDTILDDGWWRSAPGVGTLRMAR